MLHTNLILGTCVELEHRQKWREEKKKNGKKNRTVFEYKGKRFVFEKK